MSKVNDDKGYSNSGNKERLLISHRIEDEFSPKLLSVTILATMYKSDDVLIPEGKIMGALVVLYPYLFLTGENGNTKQS